MKDISPMIIRRLTNSEVNEDTFCVWNAFVNLLAMEDYQDLTKDQSAAHLVFWYEHEVQNGGHFQYFENRGTERLPETIKALGLLNAVCQQQILQEAALLWLNQERKPVETVAEFCAAALEGDFTDLDLRFGRCNPHLQQRLETYLNEHLSSFVIIE
jgi:hypothetical protein